MAKRSHHYQGIGQYADQLMDLAEGRPAFSGRGQKPSNREVVAAIDSIKKCRQGSFFQAAESKACSCGWHTKASARKRARQSTASKSSPSLSSSAASKCSSSLPSSTQSTAETSSSLSGDLLTQPTTGTSSSSPCGPPAQSTDTSSSLSGAPSTSSSPSDPPTSSSPSDVPTILAALPKIGSGPVPPKFNKTDFQSFTIRELRAIGISTKTCLGKLDILVYCPLKGRCPLCKSALIAANSVGKTKLCYAVPWPKTIIGVDMRCGKCKKHFMTHDPSYVDTLPSAEQVKREFVTGKGNGSHISLLRMLRSGLTVAQVQHYIQTEVQEHYLQLKSKYIELWDKVEAMGGVGKKNVAPRNAFPSFPSHYVPCRPHLTAMFVRDYWENKPCIMRELRTIISCHGLAIDHQRKVVKRTLGGGVVGQGGQTFTICGDFGMILGVYVVPDTALSWAEKAMSEVVDRHTSIGVAVPKFLYVDCGCCGGKEGSPSNVGRMGTSIGTLWRSIFSFKLDAMHLMLRIGREINAEHPRRKKFLTDLSLAIFMQHDGDRQQLEEAREVAGLDGPPTRTERVKFIRRVVGDPGSVAKRMELVLKAHRELDRQSRSQAEAAGMEVDNLTVADVAYPLVTQRLTGVFQQQLIHVRNGCISDDPENLPYSQVGTINFHLTGLRMNHYQSLRGTSKVEAVHSVLDRTFYSQRGIGAEVFDARLGWWILGYNRRRMRAHGNKVPPDSLTPKVCEHYIAHGLCTDFPDWSIAAAGTESSLKIGYDYGRLVTGEEQQVDLSEELELETAETTDTNQVVPDPLEDRTMVATSNEALEELGLDEVDLIGDVNVPSMFEPLNQQHGSPDISDLYGPEDMELTPLLTSSIEPPSASKSTSEEDMAIDDPVTADKSWKDVPLPKSTHRRRRNVPRLRSMGGDSTSVPPNFNDTMLSVWEELWHSMPQTGKIGVTVINLLQQYKEHCRAERKRLLDANESPAALLPVSYAQAKDWLVKQQKKQSLPLETGAVNEEARKVVSELNRSLADQPETTSKLLGQPARPASVVVSPPVLSLGPEQVTDQVRAKERAEERARRQVEKPRTSSDKQTCKSQAPKTPAPKKKRKITPELLDRQQRASARMSQLGVPPLEDTAIDGKRRCQACHQLRTANDKTPDGHIHRVLGRSNKVWCPYADDLSILEEFEAEQKERTQAGWRRANEAKRLKKKELSSSQ